MSEWIACRDCKLGTSPLCELCRGYHPVRGRNSEITALRAELEQVRWERDEAKRVFARWLDEHTDSAERIRLLEAVAEAFAEEWNDSPKCTCHEAYKNRNRDDPDCLYHKSPLLWDALAAWREGEG